MTKLCQTWIHMKNISRHKTSILSSWCQFTHQTDNWAVIPKNCSNRDLTDSLPFNNDLQPRIMYPCIVSLLFVIILTTPESRDVKESYGTQLKIQMKQNYGYMRQLETKQNKACSFALTFSAYGQKPTWSNLIHTLKRLPAAAISLQSIALVHCPTSLSMYMAWFLLWSMRGWKEWY